MKDKKYSVEEIADFEKNGRKEYHEFLRIISIEYLEYDLIGETEKKNEILNKLANEIDEYAKQNSCSSLEMWKRYTFDYSYRLWKKNTDLKMKEKCYKEYHEFLLVTNLQYADYHKRGDTPNIKTIVDDLEKTVEAYADELTCSFWVAWEQYKWNYAYDKKPSC